MGNFQIIPLSTEVAGGIRKFKKDAFGNAALVQVATGHGPCRQSLQPFIPGMDKRILFAYCPFDRPGIFAGTGPVFIHETEVEPYQDIYRFPPAIKADRIHFPLSLIGYDKQDNMVYSHLLGNEDVDDLINDLFSTCPAISYLHARNAAACCFICKIARRYDQAQQIAAAGLCHC